MANRTYHPRDIPVDGFAVQDHPLYQTWANMMARCTNTNDPGYANYGGRGIAVCRAWVHFANFARDMPSKPNEAFTLERMNNDKGYSKSNCRWATRSEQCINRRKFKNNTTGHTGVVKVQDRFDARFDFEHVRYRIGRYLSESAAAKARKRFVDLFFADRQKAVESIAGETVWHTSSTGMRGVTTHGDGGYIARATRNGVRHYLGYFQSAEEAQDARTRFLAG